MKRYFQIVVDLIGIETDAPEETQLRQCAEAISFKSTIGNNNESMFLSAEVPPTMSDAEAAHHLAWRASDLTKLKFKVFSRSLIWRE